ncbi:MAG TPA: homoserine dehydrogenase [Epulopiscium sp.]|nr:homoserine dehydrogenase [Candidatus Epulonipiscium sp.]
MNIAILGYGTVGSGVVEVINTNKESIDKRAGREINIKHILDLRMFPGEPIEHLLTDDFNKIINDKDVDIVVEVMGGLEPAYSFVKQSLKRGKSVVTSNKELVAKYGASLLQLAKENSVNFLFEASVGGGIPIIRPLNESLTADEIYEITGILNGTTNFILTKMEQEGLPFEEVLKEAQDLGYAERNPEADVEGHDACRKIAILSSLAFGRQVNYEEIPTEGITRISKEDMEYAKEMGYTIKLLGRCKRKGHEIFATVSPVMIPVKHPLAPVQDVFNAILIKGNVIGEVMFYGRGAGKLPTASAVVADIVEASKHKGINIISHWSKEIVEMMDPKDVPASYFVRVQKKDGVETKVKAKVEELFPDVKWVKYDGVSNELAFVTTEDTEGAHKERFEKLRENAYVISSIHIEG